jgi:mycothiol synthase
VGRFDAWAQHADVAATRLASRLQMRPSRSLWRLSVRLAAIAAERRDAAPAGSRLRTFVPGRDDATLNELIGRAFGEHPEKSAWEPEDLAQRRAQPWFDPSAILLAEDAAGRAIGVHWMKLEPGRGEGEVYVLGVAPDAQRSGIGRFLLLAGLDEMRRRGIALAHLFVDADNQPALRLYRSVGFRPDRIETCYSLGLPAGDREVGHTKDAEMPRPRAARSGAG